MAGTNVEQYKDTSFIQDHSYYGNGCINGWEEGGSPTSCTTRIVETRDSENQKIGTYYHYQAASVGTGISITADNANTPDTFCPLGWQMPYSGTGGDYYDKSRSFRRLLTSYNLGFDDGTNEDSIKFRSYPISNIYSGFYITGTGLLYYQDGTGVLWSSTSWSETVSYRISFWGSAIRPTATDGKSYSYALRCINSL